MAKSNQLLLQTFPSQIFSGVFAPFMGIKDHTKPIIASYIYMTTQESSKTLLKKHYNTVTIPDNIDINKSFSQRKSVIKTISDFKKMCSSIAMYSPLVQCMCLPRKQIFTSSFLIFTIVTSKTLPTSQIYRFQKSQ